jgi:hypothetical protein
VINAVTQKGGRTWIFSATRDDSHFTEFVEWQSPSNNAIIDNTEVNAALDSLNAAFPFEESDTWKEAGL